MENIDLAKVHERVVNEIAKHHRMTPEEAEKFYSCMRIWCSINVTNESWSDVSKNTKAYTSYGLKHVYEREVDKYIANNWIKAALYEDGFDVQKTRQNTAITMDDIFENSVNFRFKVKN